MCGSINERYRLLEARVRKRIKRRKREVSWYMDRGGDERV